MLPDKKAVIEILKKKERNILRKDFAIRKNEKVVLGERGKTKVYTVR